MPTSGGAALLDKNAFIEFINCPGIISDRLFALASQGNKEERIEQSNFVKLMLEIYSSDIDGKMNLVFKIFDFDGDGKISAEDVRMILSYIPRERKQSKISLEMTNEEYKSSTTAKDESKPDRKKGAKPSLGKRKGEGLYFSSMGKNDDEDDRKKDTEKIVRFIEYVF